MAHSDAFDRIYRHVPAEHRERLRRFRATHPVRRLTVQGITWEYIAAGQSKEALLILGGAMSTAESSFRQIERCESDYHVISPSYPPAGTMAPVLDGLASILDVEGIARTHVFGHSLGAGIGHAFIRRHPERVGKLVLSGFGLYGARNLRLARRYLRLFRLLPYAFVSGFYKRRMPRVLKGIDEGERAFLLAYMRDVLELQQNKKTLMGQFSLLEDMFVHPDTYRTFEPVPAAGRVLIAQAKDDTGFTPDEQAALRATYPGAQVHLFETGGHLASTTRRSEFLTALDGFLRTTPE